MATGDDFDCEGLVVSGVGLEHLREGACTKETVCEFVAGDLLDIFLLHHLN